MVNKNRALYIFKYLWDHTDEEHPATTADIIAYLASLGISTTRKTVAEDAAELQNRRNGKKFQIYLDFALSYAILRISCTTTRDIRLLRSGSMPQSSAPTTFCGWGVFAFWEG